MHLYTTSFVQRSSPGLYDIPLCVHAPLAEELEEEELEEEELVQTGELGFV